MKKTIKARCTQKVYAEDILLFYSGEVYQFEVTDFLCSKPDGYDSEPHKDAERPILPQLYNHLHYTNKRGHFYFDFYDRDYAEQYGKPCFEDCFNEINMELTSENVERVFRECLSNEKEGDNVRLVEAVHANVKMAMRRDKLKFYQEEIQGMLLQLPRKFRETDSGGWSFLNLCTREDGTQWTGSHAAMEQLVCLGIGAGKMKYLLPKPMWNILPGGMPYLAVLDKQDKG